MGYLTIPESDQLELPSNGEFFVRMKRQATYGDQLAAQSALLQITQAESNGHARLPGEQAEMVTRAELGAYNSTLIARLVVEWNLTDQNEQVIPISVKSVELLAPEDGDFLAEEATRRLGRRPDAEQRNFPKRSGRRSTGTR